MAKKRGGAGSRKMPDPMALPAHLVGWVVPQTRRGDILEGTVRCPCGNERLEFHYPGQTHLVFPDWVPTPCTAEIQGGLFFLVKAVCPECRKEHVLFDRDFHGFYGALQHDPAKAARPRPRLWPWRCLQCGSAAHTGEAYVVLDFEAVDYEAEGYADKFGWDRWLDSYGAFGLGIRCCGCGRETKGWVVAETS